MRKNKKQKNCNKQSIFLYRLVQSIAWVVAVFFFKRKFLRNEIKSKKGPFVVIANHEASLDFVNLIGATRTPMSFVISNSFYSTLPFKNIVSKLGMIPKQQFQTSLRDIGAMRSTLKNGRILVIYPAGLMCEDGQSTPIPTTTYEFLQWLGYDIYVAKTIGTYFAMPKWSSKGIRRGRTYIDVYKLFDKDELANASIEEVTEKASAALEFDAYEEQESLLVKYKNNDNIEGLENVLYVCPHCMSEFTMRIKNKNTIYCTRCGFEEKSDEYAFLHNESGIGRELRYVSRWSTFIYNNLKLKIAAGIEKGLSDDVQIQIIDPKSRKYKAAGYAHVSLRPDILTMHGMVNGEPLELKIPSNTFPSLPFKPGRYFEIQHGNVSYRCFPSDSRSVMKWVNMIKIYYETNSVKKAEALSANS